MNDFYVYAWRRPDTNAVFYIGKGRGRRDVGLKRYNPIFMNIIGKLKLNGLESTVERLHENLTEAEAFNLELEEIAKHGRINIKTGALANLTDGGEGSTGAVPSTATKAKQSASLTGIPRTGEWLARMSAGMKGNRNALGTKHGEDTRKRMGDAQKGKLVSLETRLKIAEAISNVTRMSPPRSDNTSGFKGVSFSLGRDKWQAGIFLDGKRKPLGRFDTKEQAALAYDAAAIKNWGYDCYLNYPKAANDNCSRIAA